MGNPVTLQMKPWQAVFAVTVVSVCLTLAEIPSDTWFTAGALSLASGVSALALMGAAAMVSARWSFVESIFGGLDRVYAVHKWLGVAALSLASMHLLFKAGDPAWQAQAIMELPRDWTRLVRQASFVALMTIVILALNRNIPYSQWRWWHRLSGPFFLIVILHWLSIGAPIRLSSPAGIWLTILSSLGFAAAAYKLLIYPFVARHGHYRVVRVDRGSSAAEIELEPVTHGADFHAGHFGFLRMKVDGLREVHPFTIATAPSPNGRIAFVIRGLGDYTTKLISRVEPGMDADVLAPYGRFERNLASDREIWIAGGVGISPFLAWMRDDAAGAFERVTLFYFFTPGRAFPEVDALRKLAQERGIEFVPVSTGPGSTEFIDRFQEIVREAGASSLDVAVCGPQGLLHEVRKLAAENGFEPNRIRHELFSFR
jgi:predicted ferric reductase